MIETIGNVKLVTDLWPGTDLYSDGEIEDELLRIAQTVPPEKFDDVVAESGSWPVMYHFSSIRGNIISWYPFRGDEKVLEIGSGCGAVTGEIAGRCADVTCVELSRKRSLVNANRNREKENITIHLGNFEDVEKTLPSDYDIVTLIGVFEYGSGYLSTKTPYRDFLKTALAHLAPGGKVLIAIENRFGLKYFAGCTEDHTGGFFDGIEGYEGQNRVHTFTRPELEKIFGEAGADTWEFYYPYPDYKFPMAVYSDRWLPKAGELKDNLANFDRMRVQLFHEDKVYDSMAESGLFPVFSNSFFIEVGRSGR